jgi:hypothetical protein
MPNSCFMLAPEARLVFKNPHQTGGSPSGPFLDHVIDDMADTVTAHRSDLEQVHLQMINRLAEIMANVENKEKFLTQGHGS